MTKGRHVPVKLGLLGDPFTQQYCELLKLPELFGSMVDGGCGIALDCSPLQPVIVSVPYSTFLIVSGGTPPYTFSDDGGLPANLTLDANTGEISGTALATGNSTFEATATDAESETSTCSYTISVTASSKLLLETTDYLLLEDGASYMLLEG